MMAKLVIVPTWFILNLLVLPFLSFYRYVGLRLLRERLRTAPLIDLLGPQYKGDARDRLHETDKEIVDTKHEFYRTGMNILTLLLSVIAILVTASNLQKDVVIRQLTQSKQTLDDSVLTLTLEGKLKDIQIDDLKKAIQQASPIPQVPSPPALSK
jgi:chaperonin cofactor prefoldin